MDTPRRQSAATSASASASGSSQLSIVTDWEEPFWPEFLFNVTNSEYSLNLGTRSRRLWPWRDPYYSVGLAPNCRHAFMLGKHSLHIYFLGEPPNLSAELRAKLSIEQLKPFEGEVVDVVLSNRYLVTLDRYKFDTFELDADGRLLDKHFSTTLENQSKRSGWVPTCLTIFDDGSCAWVAVGFRVKKGPKGGGDIKIYSIKESGVTEEMGRYDKSFRTAIGNPLDSEFIRRITFSQDGDRLACVTNNNTVLVWSWSQRAKSWRSPFKIQRDLTPDSGGKGTLTSVTLFNSPSTKPYVLCTTSPSSERRTGEWSFISPVPPGPVSIPTSVEHSIQHLRKSILVGAATSVGDLIAVFESSGNVRLLRLDRGIDGGLSCHPSQYPALRFDGRLSPQDSAPPTSLRFQETLGGLHIFAIDLWGKLIVKTLTTAAYPPIYTPIAHGSVELSPDGPIVELDAWRVLQPTDSHPIYQLEDSMTPNNNASPPDPQTTRTSVRRIHVEPEQRPQRRRSLP